MSGPRSLADSLGAPGRLQGVLGPYKGPLVHYTPVSATTVLSAAPIADGFDAAGLDDAD